MASIYVHIYIYIHTYIYIGPKRVAGSLLDAILHFCYNETLIRIKKDHF